MTTKQLVSSVAYDATPAPAGQGSNALMAIINRAASDPAFDVAKLEQLLSVRERWEKDEARKAFVEALTAFKANPPDIFKNKTVAFSGTKYKHASLDNVSIAIGTALSKYGLSHRWSVDQPADGRIKVTCVLMHSAGHSESVSMQSGADQSGSKNAIQALGSAVTYLERYTLLSATGMAVQDQDDDGRGSEPAKPIPGPTEAPRPTHPTEQQAEPVTFMPGIVRRKGTLFSIPNGDEIYYTEDETIANFAKLANTNKISIRVLLDLKDNKKWIAGVDR